MYTPPPHPTPICLHAYTSALGGYIRHHICSGRRGTLLAEGLEAELVCFFTLSRCVAQFTVTIYRNCILRNATQPGQLFELVTVKLFSNENRLLRKKIIFEMTPQKSVALRCAKYSKPFQMVCLLYSLSLWLTRTNSFKDVCFNPSDSEIHQTYTDSCA